MPSPKQCRAQRHHTVVLLLGALVVLTGRLAAAAPDPSVKACRRTCKQERAACNTQAQEALHTLLGDCTGSGPDRKQCRRRAKDTTHAAKAACNAFRSTCYSCCAAHGTECSARNPSTTTTAAPSTSSSTSTTTLATTSSTTTLPTSSTTSSTSSSTSSSTTIIASTTTSIVPSTTTTTHPTSTTSPASTTTTTTQPTSTTSTTSPSSTTTTSSSSTTSTTAPLLGLRLVMVATPDPVDQGDVVTYQLTVSNRDAVDRSNVSVRMVIPQGVASCQAFSDGGTAPTGCFVDRNVVWTIGTLAGGASRTVQAAFATASAAGLPNGSTIHAVASAAVGVNDEATAQADVVAQGGAPLMLGLADDADPVRIGDTVEYTLRFGNRGAAAQLNTSLVVTLPPGMTATATTGNGMVAGNTVTWALGTVNGGDGGERRLTVSVGSVAADPRVRVTQAVLSSGANAARATELTTIAADPPLGLAVVARPDPVDQNDIITYELTVTNRRPTEAADVQVRLQIPMGVASCQAFSDGGVAASSCFGGRDVTWTLGALPQGESRTVSAAFAMSSAAAEPNGTILHALGRAQDAAGGSTWASVSTITQDGAALMLGMADDADPVPAGDHVEYTLRYGNRSAAAQLNTSLVVTLPAGMTATAATGGGVIAGDTVTWSLGTVNAGDGGERRLTVTVGDLGADDPLVRVTQAVLSSGTAAARAREVTTVATGVPLGLVVVARPDPVDQNDILTYELTVTNRREVDAADVQVRLQIPSGIASCQAFSDGGVAASSCFVGRDVTWNLGALAQGASRTVSAAFAVSSAAADPNGTILHARARAQDGAGGHATAAVTTIAQGAAPLMLGMADDADPVRAGDTVEYTLRYGNRSAAAQLNTSLVVTLPAGMTAMGATGGGVVSGDTVTWTLGTVNAGDGGERRLTASVDDLGAADPLVRVAQAVVTSTGAAARTREATTVAPDVPLGLVLVATPDPVDQGDILTYELTVTNRRNADAADVQIRLQIPADVASCQAFSDGGAATNSCFAGRDVTWNLGALAQGASRTVSAAFAVSAAAAAPNGTIVHARGRAQEGAGARASAGISSIVQAAAPLMLGLADDADPVLSGDVVTYTLRFGNRSASALPNTSLVVSLPAGLTAMGTTGGGVIAGDTVTWSIGTLNAGASGERQLTATVVDLAAADPLLRVAQAVVSSGAAAARARQATTVAESVPLDLVLVATPDPVGRNVVLTYHLTVTNDGVAEAADVQLRMQIPIGVASCQAFSDGGTAPNSCFAGRDVAWNLGALAQGASRTVTAQFVTPSTVVSLPNGTIIHTTSRAQDGAGESARSDTSTAVFQ